MYILAIVVVESAYIAAQLRNSQLQHREMENWFLRTNFPPVLTRRATASTIEPLYFIQYRKSGNFRYMKFSLENIFVLKYFRRTSTLPKYFNTKILQHRSWEERTERVTVMEKFFETNCIRGYHVYKKSMGSDGWRGVGVRKRAQKPFRLIRCGCEERRNYHRTFTSKAVACVFAVFATGKYTVAHVSVKREHVEWHGV